MIKLLQQDDCAPDSLEYFEKEFIKITKMNIKTFESKADYSLVDDGMTMRWELDDWILEYSADDPFYQLHEKCKPGTVHWIDKEGEKKYAEPGSIWYSTGLMLAQKVWNGTDWVSWEE